MAAALMIVGVNYVPAQAGMPDSTLLLPPIPVRGNNVVNPAWVEGDTDPNNSDPFAIPCDGGGFTGICLYTSSDLKHDPVGNHFFPMSKTWLYLLPDGKDPAVRTNWINKGPVLKEDVSVPWAAGEEHLWAPAATKYRGFYYLLVPDVMQGEDPHQYSRVKALRSREPWGPFTTVPVYNGFGLVTGQGSLNRGYMSDPFVFWAPALSTRYLAYANGDYDTCGGLSIANLNINTLQLTDPHEIEFTNLGTLRNDLGTCGDKPYPYMEGPKLYYTGDQSVWGTHAPGPYLMIFPAKPGKVPAGCQSDNQVMAYATATDPAGPWTYKGYFMCGSTTEWTNHGTILPYQRNGVSHVIFFYHDVRQPPSGDPGRGRRVRAECLTFWAGSIGYITRSPHSRSPQLDFGFGTPTRPRCLG